MKGRTLLAAAMLFALMGSGSATPATGSHPYAVPSCKGLAAVPGYEQCKG